MAVISVCGFISSFSVWSSDKKRAGQLLLGRNMQGTWGVRVLWESALPPQDVGSLGEMREWEILYMVDR